MKCLPVALPDFILILKCRVLFAQCQTSRGSICKYFVGYFILLSIHTSGYTQHTTPGTFYITKLPPEGILLNSDWKFHAGNNIAWKDKSYNDSSWENISATNEILELPQIKKQPVGWLRIKLNVDSSLLNKPLVFQVYQSVASELYLNGELLKRYGQVSTDPNTISAYNPLNIPEGFQFRTAENILAVRFSYQKNLPYTKNTQPYSLIEFRINEAEGAYQFTQQRFFMPWFNSVYIGFFLILTFIHLGLFAIFKKQKANLYFSVSTFPSL